MFGSNSIKIQSINNWTKMIHKIHFSCELLLKHKLLKTPLLLNTLKQLNMDPLLHQLHYTTIKANCFW